MAPRMGLIIFGRDAATTISLLTELKHGNHPITSPVVGL